jgi:hypothetical protein
VTGCSLTIRGSGNLTLTAASGTSSSITTLHHAIAAAVSLSLQDSAHTERLKLSHTRTHTPGISISQSSVLVLSAPTTLLTVGYGISLNDNSSFIQTSVLSISMETTNDNIGT